MRLSLLAAVGLLLTVGCAAEGLSFTADTRVRITSPREHDPVRLPFEVRWQTRGDDVRYGVFFDSTPMRPGEGLRSLVPDGDPCYRDPRCPDARWLSLRGIYVTDGTTLRIDALPDLRRGNATKDVHQLTLVLLDSSGRRAGETAYVREFVVERE
jgi:hypothetical protein